jgi:exodeoxyribonuclease-3
MAQSIEIISWNVNGIRAVAEKGAFDWLEERQPHILCLQEIKALPEQMPENIFATRYHNVTINSAVKKGYSGTLIASALEHLYSNTRPDIDIMNEGRIVEHHYGDIVLLNVYFPNGQKDEERLTYNLTFAPRI